MDKRKLVDMIVKDLEEIRVLSVEVRDSEEDLGLIIDLALYRSRLLSQEIELLRELTGNSSSVDEETEVGSFEREEDEASDTHFSDPELEITNFDDQKFEAPEDLLGEEEEEDIKDEYSEEEEDDADWTIEKEQVTAKVEEVQNPTDQEVTKEEEFEQKDLTKTENKKVEHEEIKEVENLKPEKEIIPTELKNDLKSGTREIHIDEVEDHNEFKPIGFSPLGGSTVRPPMVEIPKPEFAPSEKPEKQVVGEKFQKERSLNDSIAENHSADSKLLNGRILNLRAAIGLNDRFLFIREIFNNNTEKYNNVIEQLDKMQQIQEAVEYLKANLVMQKNEASMKFVELLKRRFTK